MAKDKRKKSPDPGRKGAEERGETFYHSVAGGAVVSRGELQAFSKHWVWAITLGVIMIFLGFLAIIYPAFSTAGGVMILGLILLATGLVQLLHAVNVREWGGFFWHILLGLLYGAVGILLLSSPLIGAVTITFILSIYFIVSGIFKIIISLMSRNISSWVWMLFSGIVALILGGVVLLSWPVSALWFLGLVIGIDLVIGGFSLASLGSSAHRRAEEV